MNYIQSVNLGFKKDYIIHLQNNPLLKERFDAYKNEILKVAITGPESTGKSTLSVQLADHYQTVSTVECARSYLDRLSRPYEKDDLLKIARSQIAEENSKLVYANRVLFCDTELIVIKSTNDLITLIR